MEIACEFQFKNGRFPQSQQEWALQEPNLAHLLRAPEWAHRPYEVNFEKFGAVVPELKGEDQLLIEDPGIRWPGAPYSFSNDWRVGVTPDGRIVSYSLFLPIHQDRLSCP